MVSGRLNWFVGMALPQCVSSRPLAYTTVPYIQVETGRQAAMHAIHYWHRHLAPREEEEEPPLA